MKTLKGIKPAIQNNIAGFFYMLIIFALSIVNIAFGEVDGPIYAYNQLMTGVIKDRVNFDAHTEIYKDRTDIGFITKLLRDTQKENTTTSIGNYWEQRSRKRTMKAAAASNAGTAGSAVTLKLSPTDAAALTANMTLTLRVALTTDQTNDVVVQSVTGGDVVVKPNDPTKIVPAVAKDSYINQRGSTYGQGTTSNPKPTMVLPKKYRFVTQIFKNNYALSRTAKMERMYGEDERARNRIEAEHDHLEDIEWSFLFNEQEVLQEATVDSNIQRGTFPGIFRMFKDKSGNWLNYSGDFNFEDFRQLVTKNIFQSKRIDGQQKTRVSLINAAMNDMLWQFNEDRLVIMSDASDVFGVDGVMRCKFANGTLFVFEHPLVSEYYNDKPFCSFLHMRYIVERPMLQTLFQANIQNANADGIEDQYITETGLYVALPELGGGYEPN
jgi:hypothetical protein